VNESPETIVAKLTAWMAENIPDYLESVGLEGGYDSIAEAMIDYAVDQNAGVTEQYQRVEEAKFLITVLLKNLAEVADEDEEGKEAPSQVVGRMVVAASTGTGIR